MTHASPAFTIPGPGSGLSIRNEILRQGAECLLAQTLGAEADLYVQKHRGLTDERGHRLVVRNGYLPPRDIRCQAGLVRVRQPRILDRRVDADGRRLRFSSRYLRSYARTADQLQRPDASSFFLGMATGDLTAALRAMLGAAADELDDEILDRLCAAWDGDHRERSRRDLSGRRYRCYRSDEVEVHAPVEGHRLRVLLVIGCTDEGETRLLTARLGRGRCESAWTEVLDDLRARGLILRPERMADAGSADFRAALVQACAGAELQCSAHPGS